MSGNLYLAALGPLTELLGVALIVAVFALLRSQADRHAYFKAWERSWVFFGVALIIGVFYERFVDPESVFYPASTITTRLAAAGHIGMRLLSVAMVFAGVQLFAGGSRTVWVSRAALPLGLALSFAVDTTHVSLASLTLVYGPIVAVGYLALTLRLGGLPRSRQSVGTRFVAVLSLLLAVLSASLAGFYLLQRLSPTVTAMPALVRFARYGFYSDLVLQLGLAWAMVRLLIEDGHRETDDTRAHLKLVHGRDRLADLYDAATRLLTRRAFEVQVGLDFARASFGSVARLQLANYDRIAGELGPDVSEALLAHIAGVLDSSVRTHDRVYRWGQNELLIVMPRAVQRVARARIEFLIGRVAPLATPGVRDAVRGEFALDVAAFQGGEELAEAARVASRT